MGYFAESFSELYNAEGWIDMGMYIGAGSSMPGWYTVIASVMLVAILVKGNNDEQDHYKQ